MCAGSLLWDTKGSVAKGTLMWDLVGGTDPGGWNWGPGNPCFPVALCVLGQFC